MTMAGALTICSVQSVRWFPTWTLERARRKNHINTDAQADRALAFVATCTRSWTREIDRLICDILEKRPGMIERTLRLSLEAVSSFERCGSREWGWCLTITGVEKRGNWNIYRREQKVKCLDCVDFNRKKGQKLSIASSNVRRPVTTVRISIFSLRAAHVRVRENIVWWIPDLISFNDRMYIFQVNLFLLARKKPDNHARRVLLPSLFNRNLRQWKVLSIPRSINNVHSCQRIHSSETNGSAVDVQKSGIVLQLSALEGPSPTPICEHRERRWSCLLSITLKVDR